MDTLDKIRSVARDFQFFAQPKYRIASDVPGSGNTTNIGAIRRIADLVDGSGPFAELGPAVFDDYWMHYQTRSMAQQQGLERPPYSNLKTYHEYKSLGKSEV